MNIHIWGGLGSQLYGLNCALLVSELLPGKKIFLVFHSGGVTERNLELKLDKLKFDYEIIQDYIPKIYQSRKIYKPHVVKIMKLIAVLTRYLVYVNKIGRAHV